MVGDDIFVIPEKKTYLHYRVGIKESLGTRCGKPMNQLMLLTIFKDSVDCPECLKLIEEDEKQYKGIMER